MNIILNISGQIFEVNRNILLKIPYFHDMFDTCECNTNESIFVNRPSHIFKHVLALTIDPLYPFPMKYAFELDFYGIVYDKTKLYDKHQELSKGVNDIKYELTNIKIELNKNRDNLNYIYNLYNLSTPKKCIKCDDYTIENSLYCEEHVQCFYNKDGHCFNDPYFSCNYCTLHYKVGNLCDKGGCTNLRDNYCDHPNEFCQIHH